MCHTLRCDNNLQCDTCAAVLSQTTEMFMAFLISTVALSLLLYTAAYAQSEPVVDIPTRPSVTQRFLFSAPANAKAAVILFAGGHGGLQIFPSGKLNWGGNNFVVRNRSLFAERPSRCEHRCSFGPAKQPLPRRISTKARACRRREGGHRLD